MRSLLLAQDCTIANYQDSANVLVNFKKINYYNRACDFDREPLLYVRPKSGLSMITKLRLSRFVVLNFILLEILIVGVGGVVAFRLGRNHLIGVAEQNSIAVANHLARVVDEFYLRSWDLTFETFPYDNEIAYSELRGIILNFLKGFNVQRVNVINNEYRVIFSTDSTLVGREEPDNSKLLSALAGQPVSSLERKRDPGDFPDQQNERDYLETYVPVTVRSKSGEPVRMAFEVYLDVTNMYVKVQALRTVIIASSLFTGIALVIVVLLISRRAERLVVDEYRQRLALAEQIQRQNEQLESTVEQRTRQLKDAQAELVQMEKMAATGRLAAGVAHEINNPVSIIQNRLELLLDDVKAKRDVPDMDSHLSMMHKHTERISRIVSRLLSFARQSSTGKSSLYLDHVLSGVLVLIKQEIEKKGIALNTDIAPSIGPVKGNGTELEQVFINLLVNAMDATPRGGEISMRARQNNGAVTVEVHDTGHGITPENIGRIFDPFFTTKDIGVGTGLGLAISYRIIEDHGARIDVDSTPGAGTTFILTFPVIGSEHLT